jgi:hypothetical protein
MESATIHLSLNCMPIHVSRKIKSVSELWPTVWELKKTINFNSVTCIPDNFPSQAFTEKC